MKMVFLGVKRELVDEAVVKCSTEGALLTFLKEAEEKVSQLEVGCAYDIYKLPKLPHGGAIVPIYDSFMVLPNGESVFTYSKFFRT